MEHVIESSNVINSQNLAAWMWLGLAMLLLIIELLTGTVYLLLASAASVIISIIVFICPEITILLQLVIFGFSTILLWVSWGIYNKKRQKKLLNTNFLNQRQKACVGKTGALTQAIVNGYGKVEIAGIFWTARAKCDLPQGQKVKVIAAHGTTLDVVAIDD